MRSAVEAINLLVEECGWGTSGWNHNGFPGRSVAMIYALVYTEVSVPPHPHPTHESLESLMLSVKNDSMITLTKGAKTIFKHHLADPDCMTKFKEFLKSA